MKFYTYLWLREKDGTFPARTPYYVGKGHGNRAFRIGSPSREHIVIQYWFDEATAFAYERYLIDLLGRIDNGSGCLRNLTDGGDSPPNRLGKKFTEEHRRKIGNAHRGKKRRPPSETTRHKMSMSHQGRKFSEESCRRRSESNTGKKHPHRGGHRSEDGSKRMREAWIRRKNRGPVSEETRQKMAEAHRGKKRPEHAAKMRAFWAGRSRQDVNMENKSAQ